jgi:transcriptional antiterminator RfaH
LLHLQRQGFTAYLPRYQKRRRHARRIELVEAPLFPRYLFVSIDRGVQRWRSIHSTIGVSHLVCNGNDPVPVPDAVIEALRAHEQEGYVHLPVRPQYKPGQPVRILDGAFTSCLGLYDGMADRDRIAVLLDLLGRKVRILVGAHSIAAA